MKDEFLLVGILLAVIGAFILWGAWALLISGALLIALVFMLTFFS